MEGASPPDKADPVILSPNIALNRQHTFASDVEDASIVGTIIPATFVGSQYAVSLRAVSATWSIMAWVTNN